MDGMTDTIFLILAGLLSALSIYMMWRLRMAKIDQLERIANALERIADLMEEPQIVAFDEGTGPPPPPPPPPPQNDDPIGGG